LRFNSQSSRKSLSPSEHLPVKFAEESTIPLLALRMDFVAKPGTNVDLARAVEELLTHSELNREGLRSSVLLVSDRESRLVTLLTLWEAQQFNKARDRLTSWVFKLIARFADGSVRTHTGVAHFLLPETAPKLTLSDLRPAEIAELVEIASAG
jgi:hypothetical protein